MKNYIVYVHIFPNGKRYVGICIIGGKMKAKLEVNVKEVIKRYKEFYKEFDKLCSKYNLEPQLAKDDETNDNFIVVNVKDFIREEDIKMDIEK